VIYHASAIAVIVFLVFVGIVLGISFFLGSKAKSASGYFAAHGQINWFVNGIAFAGDYLSAASFLGICGMIAFYGYDGFLYSIGYLAGWVVALFVIAEPIKRLGKFTFADALNAKFQSRGIQVAAAISTLAVSIFYLIPQMVGAGALVKPLLGMPHWAGVVIVGSVVIMIVVTAGMVSTTYVQFIKGSLLVILCTMLTIAILARGLYVTEPTKSLAMIDPKLREGASEIVPPSGGWVGKAYVRHKLANGVIVTTKLLKDPAEQIANLNEVPVQTLTVTKEAKKFVDGLPQGTGDGQLDLRPVGSVATLGDGRIMTGPLGPVQFFSEVSTSTVITWPSEVIKEADGGTTTVYYPKVVKGSDLMTAGGSPTFKGVRSTKTADKLDFISLMFALFAGTASLPHILIRYYTVKDAAAARKSTVVGIASIGFFYVLTLFLGLGAMTSGAMDPTNNNMAAPLLARSFGQLPFAIISAVAFTTVLGTVSGLILAASGAVAHDLMENVFKHHLNDNAKVGAAKWTAIVVGIVAMVLGILFEKMNVTFLVGWAFNVAASANLPSLVMLLFWRGTTKSGVIAAIWIGMLTSLAWLLLSAPAFQYVYNYAPADAAKAAIAPFSQPGLVTIPLGFIVLVVVSLLTQKQNRKPGFERVMAGN